MTVTRKVGLHPIPSDPRSGAMERDARRKARQRIRDKTGYLASSAGQQKALSSYTDAFYSPEHEKNLEGFLTYMSPKFGPRPRLGESYGAYKQKILVDEEPFDPQLVAIRKLKEEGRY